MTTSQVITATTCPFESSVGYTTENGRFQYLMVEHGVCEQDAKGISKSLDADMDPSKPLYFWQLYSLIGHEPIISIVQNFYERVYGDEEEPWFRNAFDEISGIDHHVQTQALYWIDAFGGGKMYHGGNYRLNFHHHGNASHVMNAKGAKQWMHHMRGALEENCDKFDDPRVMPCIVEFLKVKMKTYAKEHCWEFDEGDFECAKNMSVQSRQ
jgi:truncated hemoglobin YjbI